MEGKDEDESEKSFLFEQNEDTLVREKLLVGQPNSNKKHGSVYTYFLTAIAALGGFLFGYDTGVISGAMLTLKNNPSMAPLSDLWQELIVSITILGAIIGSLTGGVLSDKFGRKIILLLSSFIFIVGAIVMAAASNKLTLLAGRLIVGVGIGYASSTVPVYIAEASPAILRGTLVTVNGVMITFGQFVASVIDGIFSYDTEHGWRFMLGLAALPSLLMFIGMLFLPESPRWLMKQGYVDKSKSVLQKLRGEDDIHDEFEEMTNGCAAEAVRNDNEKSNLKKVWSMYYTRRAFIVGAGLQAIQQLSGINTVMYYSATIISFAGVNNYRSAIWLAAFVAFANFFFSLIAMSCADRLGRRKLILISLTGVMVALVLLGSTFAIAKHSSPHTIQDHVASSPCSLYDTCYSCIEDSQCLFCSSNNNSMKTPAGVCVPEGPDVKTDCFAAFNNQTSFQSLLPTAVCPSSVPWLAVSALLIYLAFFSSGLGPIVWTINSEIYPLWARSTGMAVSTATNWTFNLLVSVSFLHLMIFLTRAGAFFLYAVFSLIGVVFAVILLPETKGCTLENVDSLFKGPLMVRKRMDTMTAYTPVT